MSAHPTAIVAGGASVGEETRIGPYAVVEAGVRIGGGCRIEGHAVIREGTTLGDGVKVDAHAVVGGDPQSFDFDPSVRSGVAVGDRAVIREGVTVNRASVAGEVTRIGETAYLMAHAHVAHDCAVGANAVLCPNVLLGGHVTVGERAFLGGGCAVHQFCRVGGFAMVGGLASVSHDVPPYVTVTGRNLAYGLNLIGLRRNGFSQDAIGDLKRAYRAVFHGGGSMRRKAAEAARSAEAGTTGPGADFLAFFEDSKRGFVASAREAKA